MFIPTASLRFEANRALHTSLAGLWWDAKGDWMRAHETEA
jgi:hypothetical protein